MLEKQITINNSYGLIDELADVICPQEIGICHNNYIDGFRINNLSNEGSGCTMGAYMDYTRSSYTTDLVTETIYSAQADVVESSGVNVYVGLWLDYNNDGDFNGPYEFLGSSYTADQTIVFPNIKIQKNQDFLGDRRLRIRCRTSGPFSAADFCMSPGEEGETEDYRVTIVEPEPLLAPELVTPNNDGYNDAFVIRGMNEHLENKLMIMDRFGSVKYKKDDYRNTWEGQHQNGEILPQGTYYYVFTQGKSVIKGFFELMY
ncbi:MAG: gliding motility-associated C-terminal domain-containing protein [Cytophagaceae bacterium]